MQKIDADHVVKCRITMISHQNMQELHEGKGMVIDSIIFGLNKRRRPVHPQYGSPLKLEALFLQEATATN